MYKLIAICQSFLTFLKCIGIGCLVLIVILAILGIVIFADRENEEEK